MEFFLEYFSKYGLKKADTSKPTTSDARANEPKLLEEEQLKVNLDSLSSEQRRLVDLAYQGKNVFFTGVCWFIEVHCDVF
jgi:hypothetical protein